MKLIWFVLVSVGIAASRCVAEQNITAPENLKQIAAEVSNNDISRWTPGVCVRDFPADYLKDFPYYLAGYDFGKRPVVIWELGHWRERKWAEINETTRALGQLFTEHFWCRLHNLTSPFPDADEGILLIMDTLDFDHKELSSLDVIKRELFSMRLGEKYGEHVTDYIMINSNFVAATWVNIIRPVAGRLLGRLEVYGPRKESWLPILRQKMDASVIPPWYTGETNRTDYKPVQIWG